MGAHHGHHAANVAETVATNIRHVQAIPGIQKINREMGVEEFKSIFWFEYTHRLLGRMIGLAFLIPFLVFLARRKIKKSYATKFVIMFVLGGFRDC